VLLPKTETEQTERAPNTHRAARNERTAPRQKYGPVTKPYLSAHHTATEMKRADTLSESVVAEADLSLFRTTNNKSLF